MTGPRHGVHHVVPSPGDGSSTTTSSTRSRRILTDSLPQFCDCPTIPTTLRLVYARARGGGVRTQTHYLRLVRARARGGREIKNHRTTPPGVSENALTKVRQGYSLYLATSLKGGGHPSGWDSGKTVDRMVVAAAQHQGHVHGGLYPSQAEDSVSSENSLLMPDYDCQL